MAEIKLIRADFRLIHGQVITRWTKEVKIDEIVVINDILSKDEFLSSIYVMAAPPSINVRIYSVDAAVEAWNDNKMGDGKLMILFKNVEDAMKALKAGFPIDVFQIGGLGGGGGRKNVMGPITFDNKDAQLLKEMQDRGTHVYLHVLPDEPKMELEKALEKFYI
ncbi:MAG: PTS sugar transporter subunit IIB [Erysipelotrichaceae bacterium]